MARTRIARVSLIAVSAATLMLAYAPAAPASDGFGISQRFSLLIDQPNPGGDFGYGNSQRLSLRLGEVASGDSDAFTLNTGQNTLSPSALHLGSGPSPCPDIEAVGVGNIAVVDFFLTGQDLGLLREYGGSVLFSARNVLAPQQAQVVLNGYPLAAIPAVPTCEPVSYSYPVTDLLVSGDNRLSIESLNGQDFILDEVRIETSPQDQSAYAAVAGATLDVATVNVTRDGVPFDGVRVQIVAAGQVIRSAQPVDGAAVFGQLTDGSYAYQVRESHEGGAILASGEFLVDSTNQPPVIGSAGATPGTVGNGGTATVEFSAVASDIDGAVVSASLDLRQISGPADFPLNFVAEGSFAATFTVPAAAAPAAYDLPLRVTDDRGAVAAGSLTLNVEPEGGWAAQTIQACGFTVRATQIASAGAGVFTAGGNVTLTHDGGLPLMLVGSGDLQIVTTAPQSISASGQWTVRADLGDLGVYDLFSGEFGIDEHGDLTPAVAAQYLLDEIAGFARTEDSSLELDLLLDGTPGLRIVFEMLCDEADGVPGNGAPVVTLDASLHIDGSISATVASVGGLSWDLAAGTLSADDVTLADGELTIHAAAFEFLPGTFDFDSRTAVTIPTLAVGPDGIQADGVVIDDFDFRYGGFEFQVQEASFTNESFEARFAEAVFPLPHETAEVGVEDILIADGEVTVSGGKLRMPPLKVGGWDLAGVEGEFASSDGELYIACAGELAIPGFATVFIGFRLDSRCDYLLQEFCMSAGFSGRGIPIGNTGFLLTDIGGCIADQSCQNQWLITFTASVASVDYVDPPGVSLLGADATMEIQPSPFMVGASGDLKLVGNLLGGGGFRFYEDRFEGHGNLQIPPGIPYLVAQTGLEVRWQPEFYFQGTADGVLQVPIAELPRVIRGLLGGENIQLAGFQTTIDQQAVQGSFYLPNSDDRTVEVVARYEWKDREFEFSADVDWSWPWLHLESGTQRRHGVRTVRRWESVDSRAGARRKPVFHGRDDQTLEDPAQTSVGTRADSVETFAVPPGSAPLVVLLNELPAGGGTSLSLTLTSPEAVTVDSTFCAATPGCTYVRGPDAAAYSIDSPAPGTWTFTVGDIQPGEEYELDAYFRNRPPAVTWQTPTTEVVQTTAQAVDLAWTPTDPDADPTTVTLYAVTARESRSPDDGDDGPWLIAEALPDSVTTLAWAPRTFATGRYRVVAEVRDGFGKTVRDTAAAVIDLTNDDLPLAPADLRLLPGPERLRVIWNTVNHPDLRGYRIFYREQGAAETDTFDVGLRHQHLLSALADGVPHEVWVEGYDVMGRAGPGCDPLEATPTDLGDVEAPATPVDVQAASYDPASNQVVLTWPVDPDAVAYRIHYDTDVVGPYAAVGAVEGDSPVLQGRIGQITLTGLTQGRRYYVAVSALDATGNESETSAPVPVLISTFTDSDQDGLPDDWETLHLGDLASGPQDDPDGDLVDNLAELKHTGTNPADPDTDGDRIPDGTDANPVSAADLDADGMADDWETAFQVTDPEADPDDDGLDNVGEYVARGSPADPDTDLDGLGDGYEATTSGTAVWNPDTDGGGLDDGTELAQGRNPLDPADDALTTAVASSPPAVTRLLDPMPNPFNAEVVLRFELARPGPVELAVFDLRGRCLRELVDEEREAGRYTARWDGRDDRGAAAASGVYFVRFKADGAALTRKIAMVK